jgi:hypothetical protein
MDHRLQALFWRGSVLLAAARDDICRFIKLKTELNAVVTTAMLTPFAKMAAPKFDKASEVSKLRNRRFPGPL